MAIPEKKKYRNNFLKQVIYQVTYQRNESINDTSMKAFLKALGDNYKVLETVRQQGFIIQNDGSDIKTEKEDSFVWQVESVNKDHVIVVNRDFFSITFNTYINFRHYVEVVANGHRAFAEIFDIKHFTRLGLRYVNQISPQDEEVNWSEYINSKLTDSLTFVEKDLLRRSMHSLVIAHDEETLVTINYGIFNQFFPAAITDKEFIIDIDAYTPFTIEASDQARILEKFNKTIAIYFEMSITDKLRKEMGVINEQE